MIIRQPKNFHDFLSRLTVKTEIMEGIWEFPCPFEGCECGEKFWAKDGGDKVILYSPRLGREIGPD